MRYVELKDVESGMQLAYDLFDSYGRVLLSRNGTITDAYRQRLYQYGFDGVYITDELSKDIEIVPVISQELRSKGMACIREKNIEKCLDISKQIVEDIIESGAMFLDLADLRTYDDYTYAHSVNVAVIACEIGFGLKMSSDDLENLVTAGLLHDLGKLMIPPEILNKPGRLSQEEYQIMKSHALLSYEAIKDRKDISAHIKSAVLYHHENVDGSGYPQGLEGKDQTLATRILHVADVYDALVSKRPYKTPYSPYEATEYLMGGCGMMFDKLVVETLLKYVPIYPKGTKVVLSDNRVGIVVDNTEFHNLRPLLRMMDGTTVDLTQAPNLSLMIRNASDTNSANAEQSERERKEMIQPIHRYRIVAVDDINTNLQLLKSLLEQLYDVTTLKSGKQALLYLKKNPYPDLILMDINMPEMNGIEAAKRIQEMTNHTVPILFVTASSDRETVMACRELNAAGYIIRPYNPVFIKSEIKRILTGRSDTE